MILGEASPEAVFNGRKEKINKDRSNPPVPSVPYRELPLGMVGGFSGEARIFVREVVPALLSGFLKRNYWVLAPTDIIPSPLFWWSYGDLLGMSRGAFAWASGGRGKEFWLKLASAAIPGLWTTPTHLILDKYLAERYIKYTVDAKEALRKKVSDYFQNQGV